MAIANSMVADNAYVIDVTVSDYESKSASVYIGGAGDVYVDTIGGQVNIPFKGMNAGSILPVRVTKIYNAGTTATDMNALI